VGARLGCGYYAASLIEGLLTSDVTNEFTLLTSFGDFFHDPTLAFALPHLGQGIRYGATSSAPKRCRNLLARP